MLRSQAFSGRLRALESIQFRLPAQRLIVINIKNFIKGRKKSELG